MEENTIPTTENTAPAAAEDTAAATTAALEEKVYFEDLPLHDDVLDALYDMRFDVCTPVQAKCIPHILAGEDVIGIAQTGTGKTAAYLLPILSLLRTQEHPKDAVNCLIMAPTRELARQIDQALQGFSYYMDINGVAVYGGNDGVRYEQERRSLTSGADIVIATPGRLITHLQLGTLDLSRTTHLILDEADRMLDMGFAEDILKIVAELPESRQTILFSATMPEKIAQLARSTMKNPVEVSIAISKPAEKIDQKVYLCREADKTRVLTHIFSRQKPERVILFASKKTKVKDLHLSLVRKGFNVAAMHSDLEQAERDRTINEFRAGHIDILVATDIVSRGIDIDDISLVINYDCPRDPEDYVHRIGRTARAGRDGRAITLVGEKDQRLLENIEHLLEKEVPRADLPEGVQPPVFETRGGGHPQGRGGRDGRRDNRRHKSRNGNNPSGKSDNKPSGKSSSHQRRRKRGGKSDKQSEKQA